jgi:hypothetical protein
VAVDSNNTAGFVLSRAAGAGRLKSERLDSNSEPAVTKEQVEDQEQQQNAADPDPAPSTVCAKSEATPEQEQDN